VTVEEHRTECRLERSELVGQGRLRDEEPLGCSRDRSDLGDDDEVLQLTQAEGDLVSHR
jgi:hypothetical protein